MYILIEYWYLTNFSSKENGTKMNFRYFIGYKYDKIVKPFCIFLPRMSGYLTGFKEIKCIFFLIKNDQLLEKYNKIWEKTSKMLYKKDFIGNRLTINNTK